METVLFTVVFFGILLLLAMLKKRYAFTIEPTWVAVALLPAIIWLLFSDRLSGFAGFGVELKLKAASREQLSLSTDSKISPQKIPAEEKSSLLAIPQFREEGIAALDFKVGSARYDNNVTLRYLEEVPSLKYVVFTDAADRFLAIAPASSLRGMLQRAPEFRFAQAIAEGDLPDVPSLQKDFLEESDSRAEALRKMETASEMPVVNHAREFVGLVSRDAILRAIIIEALPES